MSSQPSHALDFEEDCPEQQFGVDAIDGVEGARAIDADGVVYEFKDGWVELGYCACPPALGLGLAVSGDRATYEGKVYKFGDGKWVKMGTCESVWTSPTESESRFVPSTIETLPFD